MDETAWRRYLAGFHDARAGITEHLLGPAGPVSPYAWLAEPVRRMPGRVLDLACGSAPLRPLLADRAWLGVDLSPGELAAAARRGRGPLVRAGADALPVASGSADVVCAAMCLQVLVPLPRVLDEIRRVLRPGGMLAALVPSQSGLSAAGLLGWVRVMSALRTRHQPWPNPRARDGLPGLLRRSGWYVSGDERRTFRVAVDTPEAAALLVDALYLPGLSVRRTDAAKRSLARWARPGRQVELPLRRVVAEPAP